MEGIRSKDRVQKFGEVFTPPNIVNDMLGMLDSDMDIAGSTFLEPSCGDGNFLIGILNKKLSVIEPTKYNILRCISTIYGIDIQADNVLDSRKRMLGAVEEYCASFDISVDRDFLKNVEEILQWNIVLGDFLEEKYIKMNNEGYLLNYETEEDTGLKLIKDDGSRIDISYLFEATNTNKYGKLVFRLWNIEDMSFTIEELDENVEIKEETDSEMMARFQAEFL